MRLEFGEARRGQRRTAAVCPACGSRNPRTSRRTYDGFWTHIFKVRPLKCVDCGFYFPIAMRGSGMSPHADPIDLHLPPLLAEADDLPTEGEELVLGETRLPRVSATRPGTLGACPRCGSGSVRPAAHGPLESIVSRFHTKDLYRCLNCNASFKRANPPKLILMTLVLLSILFFLTYLALATMSRTRRPAGPPKIKDSQLPPGPPPVLR